MNAIRTDAADLEATADFLNTLSIDDGSRVDGLASIDDVVEFLATRGLGRDDALREQAAEAGADAWLARARGLRGALREVWEAQAERRAPEQRAVDSVNAELRCAPRTELVLEAAGCAVRLGSSGADALGESLALLIEPFVAAVATGATHRLRICANDECRWAFEDRSRAGRRRWCDMSACGNVAKARRYRARRKEAEGAAREPAASPGD